MTGLFLRCDALGHWLRMILVASAASGFLFHDSAHADSDTLVLKNGDRLTGEIKKLEKGQLYFKADYGENEFIVDWFAVERVESKEHFIFDLSTGSRLSGSLSTVPEKPGELLITREAQVSRTSQSELVGIHPVSRNRWGRLSFSIDGGFDFSKANNAQSLTVDSSLGYEAERWSAGARLSTQRTTLENTSPTRRSELRTNVRRTLWREPWFGIGLADFLKNDEQRLSLRSSYGGGVGRHIIRTNRAYLYLLGGSVWTNELYTDPEIPRANSAEGLVGTEFNAFNIGDVDLLTRLVIFPSLSKGGRLRIDFNTELKWDLPRDLYFSVRFWSNFDSSPLNDAPRTDFGTVTAIGWKF